MEQHGRILQCRGKMLHLGKRTLIMGILNTTPDSFSDGGQFVTVASAVERAKRMADEGADIIDVGGESTRPGSAKVSLNEELRRVIPVIEALSANVDLPISVDTYKAEVAKRALEAGAHIMNDIWGLKEDPEMAITAAAYDCPVILMHNRKQIDYDNLMDDMIVDLLESIHIAHQSGIRDENIILDPGIGFAKTMKHNITVLNKLSAITALGYPVLLGTSRKSFIQHTLQRPADDVVEGTAATVAWGIAHGCAIMRVHDVKEMKRVALMTDSIVRNNEGETDNG